MDPKFTRRDAERLITRGPASDGADLAVLTLLVAAGIAGYWTQSVTVVCTIFLGGVGTYIAWTLPDTIRRHAQRQKEKQEAATAKAAGTDSEGAATTLPSIEQTMSLIKKRRSVSPKDFTGQKVEREKIERMLEAANWAPTHNLTEAWRFVVLEGDAKLQFEELTIQTCAANVPPEKLQKTLEKLQMKKEKNWPKIPTYVAVCMKRQPRPDKLNPEWEEMCAVAAAVQNMLLAATAMGIATFWTSWQEPARESAEMKVFLGLEPEDKCLGFIYVGYSDRMDGYRGSRKPWQDKVTWK